MEQPLPFERKFDKTKTPFDLNGDVVGTTRLEELRQRHRLESFFPDDEEMPPGETRWVPLDEILVAGVLATDVTFRVDGNYLYAIWGWVAEADVPVVEEHLRSTLGAPYLDGETVVSWDNGISWFSIDQDGEFRIVYSPMIKSLVIRRLQMMKSR